MLERIKTLLGIEDKLQDDLLEILLQNVESHLKALIGKDVPSHLEYIILEITVRRYNRLGAEGMRSESTEGHTTTFYDLKDEFVPYRQIIDAEKDDDGITQRGRVRFI